MFHAPKRRANFLFASRFGAVALMFHCSEMMTVDNFIKYLILRWLYVKCWLVENELICLFAIFFVILQSISHLKV